MGRLELIATVIQKERFEDSDGGTGHCSWKWGAAGFEFVKEERLSSYVLPLP